MSNLDTLIQYIIDSPWGTGADLSYWQERFDMDDPEAIELKKLLKILEIVWLRATHGTWKDTKFEIFFQELVEHPEPLRGVYGFYVDNKPWIEQADVFIECIAGKDFDIILWDVEKKPFTAAKQRQYSLNGIKILNLIKEMYPNTLIMVYSRKDIMDMLLKYTSEWKNYHYHHAQYPWYHWYELSFNFMSYFKKIFVQGGGLHINLPNGFGPNQWEVRQIGDKTGLGKVLGVKSKDIDLNITRRLFGDFIQLVGVPKRWEASPPSPLPVPSVDRNVVLQEAIDAVEALKT